MKKANKAVETKLLAAFDAMVIIAHWGQPCYRTENNVPQEMPKDVGKKVRAALKALREEI
mgnify:CR=1 FL=1